MASLRVVGITVFLLMSSGCESDTRIVRLCKTLSENLPAPALIWVSENNCEVCYQRLELPWAGRGWPGLRLGGEEASEAEAEDCGPQLEQRTEDRHCQAQRGSSVCPGQRS